MLKTINYNKGKYTVLNSIMDIYKYKDYTNGSGSISIEINGFNYYSVYAVLKAEQTNDNFWRMKFSKKTFLEILTIIKNPNEKYPDIDFSIWHSRKEKILFQALTEKYKIPYIKPLLINTAGDKLEYINNWHDNWLGSCICSLCDAKPHLNRLGIFSSNIRDLFLSGNHNPQYMDITSTKIITNTLPLNNCLDGLYNKPDYISNSVSEFEDWSLREI